MQAYQKIGALGEKGEGVLKRSITVDNILSLFTGKKTAFMVFVAGFIGSPPMNMALGRVERDGDDLTVLLGRSRLPLPASVGADRTALTGYAGRQVAVGIRSEVMEDARLGLGLGPDDPFGEPELWVDKLPEPRDGITEPLADAPLGPGRPRPAPRRAGVRVRRVGRDVRAGDGLRAGGGQRVRRHPAGGRTAGRLDAMVADSPYEPPVELDDVDDAYAAPAFAPVAEASDVHGALAAPDVHGALVG